MEAPLSRPEVGSEREKKSGNKNENKSENESENNNEIQVQSG